MVTMNRKQRAKTEDMSIVAETDSGVVVRSESGSEYEVDASSGFCECPDAQIRGEKCKHQHFAEMNSDTSRTMTEYVCTVHYDDDNTDTVSVFVTEEMCDIPKLVRRAARDKAEHVGQRNYEGGSASERPHASWAEIESEREVEVN